MKKRTLWKMFLLEVITAGIYTLYFLVKTRDEMMQLNPNIKIKSSAFLFVSVILSIAGAVLEGTGVKAASLLFIVSLVIYLIWLWSYSRGVATITSDKLNVGAAFLVLWLLQGISALIVQYFFNEVNLQPSQLTYQQPPVGQATPPQPPMVS